MRGDGTRSGRAQFPLGPPPELGVRPLDVAGFERRHQRVGEAQRMLATRVQRRDAARSVDPDLRRRALAMALAGLRDGQSLPGASPDGEAIDRLHEGRR